MKDWIELFEKLQPIDKDVALHIGKICENIKPQRILEIGSGWGLSTRALLHFAPAAHIITIDKISPEARHDYKERTDGFQDRLEEIIGDSTKIVPTLEGTFDLIYIDGSHVYGEVLLDLRNALNKIESGGTIIMDDVLHQKNVGGEYGVLMALRQVLMENNTKPLHVSIALVGHGQAVINL